MLLKVGHRGARAYAPENTLPSFKKAMQLGVDAIEFDVMRTRDGKLVVFHDKNTKRLTGKNALVKNMTLKEIKSLNVNGAEIPTLEEALKFIGRKVKKIIIELKQVGIEKKVLSAIRKYNNIVIASFHEDALRNVRKLNKKIELGFIYANHRNPIKPALKLNAQYLVPLYRFTHAGNVQKAHENGLKVVVWTVNTKREAKEMKKKGVDGIVSDKPDILKGL